MIVRSQARALKKTGAHIIAVGIGRNLNHAELNVIADRPLKKFKFIVKDFKMLDTIASKVKKEMFCAPREFSNAIRMSSNIFG